MSLIRFSFNTMRNILWGERDVTNHAPHYVLRSLKMLLIVHISMCYFLTVYNLSTLFTYKYHWTGPIFWVTSTLQVYVPTCFMLSFLVLFFSDIDSDI